MPNFELHTTDENQAQEWLRKIRTMDEYGDIEGPGAKEGVRISTVSTPVLDLKGDPQPFIRVYVSNEDQAARISNALWGFVAFEVILLHRFQAKKS